jgi:catechol 2,3-dioxygenase-like lactoylglutathione lyase family enzyme
MKKLHVHVNVADLERSVLYYSTLFGAEPTVRKPDYAKWLLEDPRVNFAISSQGRQPGIDHLGIQTESRAELDQVAARLDAADYDLAPQEGTSCCYAVSDKAWSQDPSGVKWESFFTFGESTTYGSSAPHALEAEGSACCTAEAKADARARDAACCGPSAAARGQACCG